MAKRTIRQLVTVYSDGSIEVQTKGAGARFNPTTRAARGRGATTRVQARAAVGNRAEYRAKFGRKVATFYAKNDNGAERYANGLLAHKMGRKPSSLQRTGKRERKS